MNITFLGAGAWGTALATSAVRFGGAARAVCHVPLVASGGAGEPAHFAQAFLEADVDAALAASVFHSGAVEIPALKRFLRGQGIEVRL